MEVIILPSATEAALAAARVVARLVREKPHAVLGLATGETPRRLYEELVRAHREEGLDLSRVTTFNLDEYVGLDEAHPASYVRYMRENLFRHVNLRPDRTHVPDGRAADVDAACAAYEEAIRAAGGVDLQLLGLGADGHIGFNEPTSSLASRTRVKTLTAATREAIRAGLPAGEEAPRHVITMGIGTILEARRCVLVAFGARKAAAVAKAVEGPVTALVPASALQLHARTTVLLDEDAARQLALAAYYRDVHANKPAWQRERDGA
ncbi:MAG TPA: glucosamine-6-phosphate deaminase [Anaeromyxobacter sp.]|nr:glucosamine-6-phosphate deaminase [Anaeromyxobacter sp.]